MKTIIFAIASFLLLASCSAGDKYLRSDAPSGGIEIPATDTDDHALSITSSASWIISSTGLPEWFDLRYDASDTGLLWAGARTRNESLDSLRTVITIISGDGLRLDIPFVQLPMVVSFALTPGTLEPFGPRDATPRTLTVASTLTWESLTVGDADWLTLTPAADPDSGVETLTVTASPTRELDPRRDTIVVRPVNEAFHLYSDSIAVVQLGIDLVVYSDAMTPAFDIAIPASGGEIALSVFSRHSWTLSHTAPPATVALDITHGDPDTGNGVPVILTAPPNPSSEPITFTLTFTSGGETYTYTCTQQGGAPPPPEPPTEEPTEEPTEPGDET